MCDYDAKTTRYSPDRMDALVWAFTELMTEASVGDNILAYYEMLRKQREESSRK
jgi:phage terminase large subunit-like protein